MGQVLSEMKKAKRKLKQKRAIQYPDNERYLAMKKDTETMKRELMQLRRGAEQIRKNRAGDMYE